MEFKIKTKLLQKALNDLAPLTTFDHSQLFAEKTGSNTIKLEAANQQNTDYAIQLQTINSDLNATINLLPSEDIVITSPGNVLLTDNIIKLINQEKAEWLSFKTTKEIDDLNNTLEYDLIADKSHVHAISLDPKLFPHLPQAEEEKISLPLSLTTLTELLNLTINTVGTDSSRIALTAIKFAIDPDQISTFSTNSFFASQVVHQNHNDITEPLFVLIPAANCKAVLNAFKNDPDKDNIQVSVTKNENGILNFSLKTKHLEINVRLLDNSTQYPDTSRFWSTDFIMEPEIDLKSLKTVLNRLKVMLDSQATVCQLNFSQTDQTLTLSLPQNTSKIKETIPVQNVKQDYSTNVDLLKFITLFKNVNADNLIIHCQENNLHPLTFTLDKPTPDKNEFSALLCPVRSIY